MSTAGVRLTGFMAAALLSGGCSGPVPPPAELRVETTDRSVLTHRSAVPPGGSTRPLSEAQIVDKFRDCAADALSPEAVAAVVAQVLALDTLPDVAELCETLEGIRRDDEEA